LACVHREYVVIDEAHRIKNDESSLAKVVRTLNTCSRLLITGTPLQNNIRELWALLNFLLPDVFSDAELFESLSMTEEGEEREAAIAKLHSLLKPFILRRQAATFPRPRRILLERIPRLDSPTVRLPIFTAKRPGAAD
jgi:SWI/SNF-related matrix-associated actin-dependent regulator of chromatin subfamily A member 5